jgi:uncharacterized damage-inducible protein DinB
MGPVHRIHHNQLSRFRPVFVELFMARPQPDEHAPYFSLYIDRAPGDSILDTLTTQSAEMLAFWRSFSEEQAAQGPAGKWTIKQVLNHITDTERIFAYRALRIGRGDTTALPGFEQDGYVENSGAATRSWASLLEEYETGRRSTLQLLGSFPAGAWTRRGTSSNGPLTTLAAAYIIAGHELHHLAILRAQYL